MYTDKPTHKKRTLEQKLEDGYWGFQGEILFEQESGMTRHPDKYLDYVGSCKFRGVVLKGIIEVKTVQVMDVAYCIPIMHETLTKLGGIPGTPLPDYFIFYYCDRRGINQPFVILQRGFAGEAIIVRTFEIGSATQTTC